jgi:hypothetical protein
MISAVSEKDADLNIRAVKRRITEEAIPMKLTWHGNKGWSGYLAGKNSTQGGDR